MNNSYQKPVHKNLTRPTPEKSQKRRQRVNSATKQRKLSESRSSGRKQHSNASFSQNTRRQNVSPRQQRRPPMPPRSAQTPLQNGQPLKFEGEFDFEQANARFEQEIEKEFDKLKIGTAKNDTNNNDTSLNQSQSMNLQDEQHLIMKKSIQSALDSQTQPQGEHMSEENKNFYDKNISFFDRISCEANEKSMIRSKNWKEERKLNSETFGLQNRNLNYTPRQNYQYRNSGGRNYPRNNSGQHQYRQSNNSNNQMRWTNTNGQRVQSGQRTGGYQTNGYRMDRRNDNYVPIPTGQRVGGRRFGSR
ncbi:LSM14 -like protein [Brachionus plicatilis]|uniref:LSM14-like protein n=1 Tax=Brachionus plicatilis TaxID=10195 RepID=A0A3M7S5Q2_BRAPC|nr:LSM14 -like protein [Brachionus plicatilis]